MAMHYLLYAWYIRHVGSKLRLVRPLISLNKKKLEYILYSNMYVPFKNHNKNYNYYMSQSSVMEEAFPVR